MKQWLDFIPLFAFFISYKLWGIFPATKVLLIGSVVVYGGMWLKYRQLESNQKIILFITILLGSATLLLHDEAYLKWKAPVVYWITAIAYLGSLYIGKEPLVQKMLGTVFEMPTALWRKLNWAWIGFFIFAGASNAYVAFYFEKYWVDFKIFGSMAMLIVFMIAQFALLSRYLKQDINPSNPSEK